MRTGRIRIGTRGSQLALAQAGEARDRLMALHDLPEEAFSIEVLTTTGDRIRDRPLSEAGGKGLFTKELEEALLSGRIDLAVHSAKDVATVLPDGLELAAFLPREDPRDVFVGRTASRIADLRSGAVVGSASLRRQALLRRMRPDLQVVLLRGNVQTRLRRLEERALDGTLLALAGLKRIGRPDIATDVMSLETFPPAPGQGAICIEIRSADREMRDFLRPLDDAATATALACERAFLAALNGSCRTPIAGHASVEKDRLVFRGAIVRPDGTEMHEIAREGPLADAAALGAECGRFLKEKAGPDFFSGWSV